MISRKIMVPVKFEGDAWWAFPAFHVYLGVEFQKKNDSNHNKISKAIKELDTSINVIAKSC